MNNGFAVIDADRHVMEPSDLWDRYLEPEFKGRVKITGPFQSRRYIDGRSVSDSDQLPRDRTYDDEAMKAALFTEDPLYRSVFADGVAHGFEPASNLRDMDREGVDVAVLFPTLGLYIIWDDEIEPEISAAICRAYNNWLAEYCSHNRARLKGVALIPLHDTRLAVEELRRAKNELGLSGIFWRPNRLKGRTFGHPDYFPIYEVASELEVPVCVHEGARTVMTQAGSDRYSPFGRHVACHPLEQMLAALTFAADGVSERFPESEGRPARSGMRLAPLLAGADGRTLEALHAGTGAHHERAAEHLLEAAVRRQLRSRRGIDRLLRGARRRRLSHHGH